MKNIPLADATLNITDDWAEKFDPNGETGNYVEAMFDAETSSDFEMHDRGHGAFTVTEADAAVHYLIGITIEDREQIVFHDLEAAINMFGSEAIGQWQGIMDRRGN